jgi:hypothetical protein
MSNGHRITHQSLESFSKQRLTGQALSPLHFVNFYAQLRPLNAVHLKLFSFIPFPSPLIFTTPQFLTVVRLNEFPNEVLHSIFSSLQPKEVEPLRLISRQFATIGTEYLLPEVQVELTLESFVRLQEISQHPEISRHVIGIKFSTTELLGFNNIVDFYAVLKDATLSASKHFDFEAMEKLANPTSGMRNLPY